MIFLLLIAAVIILFIADAAWMVSVEHVWWVNLLGMAFPYAILILAGYFLTPFGETKAGKREAEERRKAEERRVAEHREVKERRVAEELRTRVTTPNYPRRDGGPFDPRKPGTGTPSLPRENKRPFAPSSQLPEDERTAAERFEAGRLAAERAANRLIAKRRAAAAEVEQRVRERFAAERAAAAAEEAGRLTATERLFVENAAALAEDERVARGLSAASRPELEKLIMARVDALNAQFGRQEAAKIKKVAWAGEAAKAAEALEARRAKRKAREAQDAARFAKWKAKDDAVREAAMKALIPDERHKTVRRMTADGASLQEMADALDEMDPDPLSVYTSHHILRIQEWWATYGKDQP